MEEIPRTGMSVSQDLRNYYKIKYWFDDVDFIVPGSFGSSEPKDQAGKIILTRDGVTKSITVTDILWQQGFDGIDDVLDRASRGWTQNKKLFDI